MFKFFKKKISDSTSPEITVTDVSKDSLDEKLKPLSRTAWTPKTVDGDTDPTACKFSGLPYIDQANPWPTCPNCENPMQHFMQLNLETLPEMPTGCPEKGLIQLFYCTNEKPRCESDCEAFFHGSKSVVARFIGEPDVKLQELDVSPVSQPFPAKMITDWESKIDYPSWEEMETAGVKLSDDDEQLYDEFETPICGDKLMGWPAWVQGVEYPNCSVCERQMVLLFQIDSECNLPYMFGDAGCSHLCQCSEHPEQLEFGWACC